MEEDLPCPIEATDNGLKSEMVIWCDKLLVSSYHLLNYILKTDQCIHVSTLLLFYVNNKLLRKCQFKLSCGSSKRQEGKCEWLK